MTCPRCRHDNPGDAVFCQECGTRLETACPSCGTANQLGAKFCKKCGQRLSGPQAEPAMPGPRFGPPERYTPKHLAEKILTSKAALEGERKQVTVLFADLKGSMELLADRDPEEARKLLDPVLEHMMGAVHRYEGTVNQVMGDGIMALFGAPLAHEDHAVRACYAALDMQTTIRRYAEEVRRSHGVVLQIRIGLNSGEVVVRAIGSDLRMDYSAIGQTTHLAARTEQLAKPDTTLLTTDVLRLAEGFIAVTPLGPMPVKGLNPPIELYELTGAGPRRSRLHAAAARGLSRFVGREAELEHVRQAIGRAAAGHGQVVAIVGEPGVGKSRLVWEVTHSHRTHGWLILQAGSVSYGKATLYLPMIDLLKGYLQVSDRDEPRAIREKVTGKLLALLDVPVVDRRWDILSPPERRQRSIDALKRLLLRESQVQPLLVVFEDLHWIDAETQAVLDRLVESLPTARLLLLVNYRPEYRHGWGGKTYYRQLRLDPLAPENATALLETLLGGDANLESLKRLLLARTEGNPFFLEESVQSLVDQDVLAGARGAYRLVKTAEAIHVPATVQTILAARIDRLPAEDKDLLQTASVVGTDVPVAVLAGVAGASSDALSDGLARLQAAEFLYETSLFSDLEYTFKHALTHEVAYGSLLQDRRRALHARIADAIEALYPERLTEQIERIAHHAVRGEVWDKALAYLRQAGDRAVARSAYREAVAAYEEACVVLRHLPDGRGVHEQAIDLRLELRDTLQALGEMDRVLDHLSVAEKLAAALGDDTRRSRVAAALSNTFFSKRWLDRAVETGTQALRFSEVQADVALQVSAHLRLGAVYYQLGDYRQAAGLLRRAIDLIGDGQLHERFGLTGLGSVMGRFWLVKSLIELGEFSDAMVWAREAGRIATSADHPFSVIASLVALGELHVRQGSVTQAIPAFEHALEIGRAKDFRGWFAFCSASLGYAYAMVNRAADAIPLLEQASSGEEVERPRRMAWLAEAHLVAGGSEEATRLAGQAVELARSQKEQGTTAWTLRLFGEIATRGDAAAFGPAAASSYQEALALASDLGMRPLVAHCHLGLGKLYRRTGDGAKAEDHLTTARAMYREMDMGFWLEKAEEV